MPKVSPSKPQTAKSRKKPAKAPASPFAILQARILGLGSSVLTYFAAILTLAAIGAVLMLFFGGYFTNAGKHLSAVTDRVAASVGFSVSRVTLRGGTFVTDRDILAALADDRLGTVIGRSLLHADLDDMRRRILSIGWVESAAVQRLWPNTIHVSIEERAPIALWQDGEGAYRLVDIDARILGISQTTDHVDLPVIVGLDELPKVTDLLAELGSRPELLSRIATISSVNGRRFDLTFRNRFLAKLPETELSSALDRLVGLNAGDEGLSDKLDYIDLTTGEDAYVRQRVGG